MPRSSATAGAHHPKFYKGRNLTEEKDLEANWLEQPPNPVTPIVLEEISDVGLWGTIKQMSETTNRRTQVMIPEEVENVMHRKLRSKVVSASENFARSVVEAIEGVKGELGPEDEIVAYLEGDERSAFPKNRIDVHLDVEDDEDELEAFLEKEHQIESIVRDAEREDVMIYVYVDRKRSN